MVQVFMKAALDMCGYVDMFRYVWICLDICGYVQICGYVDMFRYVCMVLKHHISCM